MTPDEHFKRAETLLGYAEKTIRDVRPDAKSLLLIQLAEAHARMAASGTSHYRENVTSYRDAVNQEEQDQVHPRLEREDTE